MTIRPEVWGLSGLLFASNVLSYLFSLRFLLLSFWFGCRVLEGGIYVTEWAALFRVF